MTLKTLLLAFALTDVTIIGGRKTNGPTNQGARTKRLQPLWTSAPGCRNKQTNKQTNMEDCPSYEANNFSLTQPRNSLHFAEPEG